SWMPSDASMLSRSASRSATSSSSSRGAASRTSLLSSLSPPAALCIRSRIVISPSPRVVPTGDDGDRLDQDLGVERERPTAQVLEVAFDARAHLRDRVGLAAQAANLREARDPGFHFVAHHVAADDLSVDLVVRHGVRARADQAHAPLHYVDE